MSDLRNIYGSDISDIKIVEPVERVEPTTYTPSFQETEIGGSAEPLAAFHTIEVEETSNTGRIVGGLAIALMVGAAGVFAYEVSNSPQASAPKVTQTAANMPAPAPAMTPPAQSAAATPAAPMPSDALSAPVAPSPAAPAPAKKAPARSARALASTETVTPSAASPAPASIPAPSAGVPEQSAAVQPVYPAAPASALANNNNEPVVTPELPDVAPAVPDVTPAQPAPDQAQPAPAPDPSAQPAQ